MRCGSILRSHIGSLPVSIPSTVKLIPTITPTFTNLSIDGPLGSHHLVLPSYINLDCSDPTRLTVACANSSIAEQRGRWGLSRSLINNAVIGVTTGYTKQLSLVGVGYRASMVTPTQLHLKLGFAHPVLIDLPTDVVATTPSSTEVLLSGIDKQRVGEVAASIRRWRVPEPYNGKGIFVDQETVIRKEVKKK